MHTRMPANAALVAWSLRVQSRRLSSDAPEPSRNHLSNQAQFPTPIAPGTNWDPFAAPAHTLPAPHLVYRRGLAFGHAEPDQQRYPEPAAAKTAVERRKMRTRVSVPL